MNDSITTGDFVSVAGGTFDKSGKFSGTFKICSVIEAGKEDLLVCDYPRRSFDRAFKVPRSICTLLKIEPDAVLSATVKVPEIGDLVLSYTSRDSIDSERVTGILYSITYVNGKPDSCKIIRGEELVDSKFSDLMVI